MNYTLSNYISKRIKKYMSKLNDNEYRFKIMMLGETQIGKTSFIRRYVTDSFSTGYITTIGIDFQLKIVSIKGKTIKLQIFDTAGQERFRNITKNYFQSSNGFIIAYDITSRDSFNNVTTWLKEVSEFAPEETKKILIGTKGDLPGRQVQFAEGEKLAKDNGMKFFETSSKLNQNVKETFETLTLEMIEEYDNNNNTEEASTSHTIEINKVSSMKANEEKKKKEKCCH